MDKEAVYELFAYEHLPPHLKAISALFYTLAVTLVTSLPSTPERTLALRELWAAKNLAVFVKVQEANRTKPA